MYYWKNINFWMFGFFFFFYFFIMGAYFPFFPIWLHDINHISKGDTGIIFACISLFSLLSSQFSVCFLISSAYVNIYCG
ncbi:Lactose-proton symport [Kluyvera cryocrescens]|uniref:Lactose-proton symport n=1 Tax=Kluyvera cryocrescens TaxID=580 RepID=A0A485ATM4_KLUCR|nr:Lactose-proton symport [Kluyvera cryocrescens]